MPVICKHSLSGHFGAQDTTPLLIRMVPVLAALRDDPDALDLLAGGLDDVTCRQMNGVWNLDAEWIQVERFHELNGNCNTDRDRPEIEEIIDSLNPDSHAFVENTARLALGIFGLSGWPSSADRYTLAKTQIFYTAARHGQQVKLRYQCMPRDLFDMNLEELTAYLLDSVLDIPQPS